MDDPPDPKADGKIKVLIVEDEFFIADELRRSLTAVGLLVLGPVASVDAALFLIGEDRPDVAVLDVHLGRERVTPVALELEELDVPFVLATASPAHELASEPVLARAINLGKPTDATLLVETVRELALGGQ